MKIQIISLRKLGLNITCLEASSTTPSSYYHSSNIMRIPFGRYRSLPPEDDQCKGVYLPQKTIGAPKVSIYTNLSSETFSSRLYNFINHLYRRGDDGRKDDRNNASLLKSYLRPGIIDPRWRPQVSAEDYFLYPSFTTHDF